MPVTGSLTISRQDLDVAMMQSQYALNAIAPVLFPPLQVPRDNGRFGVVPVKSMFQNPATRRNSDGSYNRTDWKPSEDSYQTEEHGLEQRLDDRAAARFMSRIDFELHRGLMLRAQLVRAQEIRVKDLCHDTTNFAGATNTLAITNEWDDAANAVPLDDIRIGIDAIRGKCGLIADTLQISYGTLRDLSKCAQVLDRLKYTTTPDGVLNTGVLAAALGVRRIIVGDALVDSAAAGLAAVLGEIWSDEYAFLAVTSGSADPDMPCIGRTLFWNEDGGGVELTAEEYREEARRAGILRVRHETHEKRMSTIFGFLFSNVATN